MSDLSSAFQFMGAAIISLLIISNPVSTSAVFIALTENMTREEKIRIIRKAVKNSTAILIFFSLTGLLLFQLFGFGIGAFRIAGGILLFTTAIGMLNPVESEKAAGETMSDIAIIPLAIPFISGPGTIVTVVVLMSEAQNIMRANDFVIGSISVLGVYLGIAAIIIASYFMMIKSENINKIFREGGRKVVTRLMGLLVMAIAIQFIINGIKDVIPEFIEVTNAAESIISYLPF